MNSKQKNKNKQQWEDHCKELVKFRKNNPDRWPSALKKGEQKLAFWLVNCKNWYNGTKSKYGYGPFSQDRYIQLKNIGYDLKVTKTEKQQQAWDKKFDELKKGLQIYGDTYQTKFFAKWLSVQRQEYKNGKLSVDQIEKLRSIGNFLDKPSYSEIWDQNYAKLEKYLNDNNGILYYSVNGRSNPLYRWLHGQKSKSKYNNKLSQEQIKKIQYVQTLLKKPIKSDNSAKPEKSIRSEIWDQNYEKLEKYLNDNNGIITYRINDKRNPLYRWLSTQNRKYKHNELSPEQAGKLKSLKIQHGVLSDIGKNKILWNKNYEKLEKYLIDNNGIIASNINGKANHIYRWLHAQQDKYKRNKLSQEQIRKLISIGIPVKDWIILSEIYE